MNILRLARDEIFELTKLVNAQFASFEKFADFYRRVYFTRSGQVARRLRIQFLIDEQFTDAQNSVSRSKFIKRSHRQGDKHDVNLVVTQDITFDQYLLFKLCLQWIENSDNSTIYCDFREHGRANPFIKGNWDFLYHRSISLLAPIYFESTDYCSLNPIKMDGAVVTIRNTGEYIERLPSPFKEVEISGTAKEDFESVSIVIPTANKVISQDGKQHWLIGDIVREISQLKRINCQFIIVHNGNMTKKQMAILRSYGEVKFIHFTETKLNISRKINMGVKWAKYEKLILANDDIKGATNGWLEKLLIWLDESYAGVVVPRIHYTNGSLQYAGIELDSNRKVPHIIGYRTSAQNQGYGFSFVVPRQLDAASGVLMATRKSLFDRVGGWDEKLAINYNDVDYGLRVREAGLSIIFEPSAQIFHLESASRDATVSHKREEQQLIKRLDRRPVTSFWPNLADYSENQSPSIGFDYYLGSIVRATNRAG
jgi:GT2 family glycosyltransferase